MNCLVGEVGELAGLIKHIRRGETVPKGSIANELADIQIYLDLLAYRLGVELELAVVRKFNTTSESVGSDIKLRAG